MAKVYTFLVVLAAITVLLTLVGVSTSIGTILTKIGISPGGVSNVEGTTFWNYLGAVFAVAGVVGIVASFFGRQPSESTIVGSFCAFLLTFATDYVSLMNYVNSTYPNSFSAWLISFIFIPLIVGYGLSIISFWRGSD